MTIDQTARLALPLLVPGQAQKEIMHNESLARIDLACQCVAQSADLAVPPASPTVGHCWIVAAGASGAWAARDGQIAGWSENGWIFLEPNAGWRVSLLDRGHAVQHDGVEWLDVADRADGYYVGGDRIIGDRLSAIAEASGGTTIDAEARGVIGLILGALRDHGLIET